MFALTNIHHIDECIFKCLGLSLFFVTKCLFFVCDKCLINSHSGVDGDREIVFLFSKNKEIRLYKDIVVVIVSTFFSLCILMLMPPKHS